MNKNSFWLHLLFILGFTISGLAQDTKEKDVEAIKAMCGCYEVAFNFAETFAPDKNYKFHDRYRSGALEWVTPVEESNDKIVLQHLLIINDTMIIKHWRQDWLYENTGLYTYYKDNQWNYGELPQDEVRGQWTQKVYQVDDSPRYEGTATWIHTDGKHYWENTTDAPLPRREHTKRNDYNVTRRTNRQEITSYGWLHEQDNDKIVRNDQVEDKVLAQEKGMNYYRKTEDARCDPARKWWKENQEYWARVRGEWDAIFARKTTLKLLPKANDKRLYEVLFDMDTSASSEDIKDAIVPFIAPDNHRD
ncbi:hypothetical protein SAMN02927921_02838 [Sinomicrobium oceani]|uniref:DKNYY family protein n=1 Tax=Sinomicrobium oceani TaxID=1150368 RepID=A0A1K1QUG8_9FLAO|nr:DUF6607 family protein [Sinomicrobium oceani]SFW62950.1 hypothetical protein SAMN02927921_02838 [Sinomicrobium oceani]